MRLAYSGVPVHELSGEYNYQWWIDPKMPDKASAKIIHYAGLKDHSEKLRLLAKDIGKPLTKPVLSKGCGCGGKINGTSPVQADAERRRIERLKRDAIRAKLNK
jgi:hypothetical protein